MDEESISCFPGLIQHQNLRSLENVGFHTLEWRKSFLPNDTQYSTGLLRKHQELNCNISCFMLLPVMMEHFFPIKSQHFVIHLSYLGCKRFALRCLLFTQYLIATLECIHRKARTRFLLSIGWFCFSLRSKQNISCCVSVIHRSLGKKTEQKFRIIWLWYNTHTVLL